MLCPTIHDRFGPEPDDRTVGPGISFAGRIECMKLDDWRVGMTSDCDITDNLKHSTRLKKADAYGIPS